MFASSTQLFIIVAGKVKNFLGWSLVQPTAAQDLRVVAVFILLEVDGFLT